jgi:glycosyltransferase involved in cell wall biosynthesis
MRIALLTDGIWPFVIGGMQKHSYFLCKYLLKEGATVHLFHTSTDDHIPELSTVFDVPNSDKLVSHYVKFPTTIYFPGHYIFRSYLYSKAIFKEFEKLSDQSFDFIYIQGLSGWELLNNTFRQTFSTPTILNFHGLEMFQESTGVKSRFEAWMFRQVVRKLINRSSFVQSLGGKLTTIIRQNLSGSYTSIFELGIGIEDDWIREGIRPTGKPRVFSFIGRYERRKGVEELYQALINFQNRQDFEMHFIGPIPGNLQFSCSNFKYHGTLHKAAAIQEILDQTDFLIVPSFSEGMPTVIMEAMARGCAIIATDVGAVSEQVGNSNGILLNRPTVTGIQQSLELSIQKSNEEVDAMKYNSLHKVSERFRWSIIIQKLIDHLSAR